MGRPPRFFASFQHVNQLEVTLSPEEANHVRKVLRLEVGDPVLLFDGIGREYQAVLIAVGEKVVAKVSEAVPVVSELTMRVILAQALIRNAKMDWLVEKLTELGIGSFLPFVAHRSVVKLTREKGKSGVDPRVSRWQRIAQASAKQCGRAVVPTIEVPCTFSHLLSQLSRLPQVRYVLSEQERDHTLKQALQALPEKPTEILLAVGPEGGWEEEELSSWRAAGFVSVSLGKRILRAETAGIAALAMLNYQLEM